MLITLFWRGFHFFKTMLVVIVCCELILFLTGRLLELPFPAASYKFSLVSRKSMHADMNSSFGVWRQPNYIARQTGPCFDAIFTTNRFGARDDEWNVKPEDELRGILLGDSFLEGYGVDHEQRATEIFENETGIKLLNLSTAGHCGPTQYRLIYQSFKDSLTHDFVIVGLNLPNELSDEDLGQWMKRRRYRPYLSGEYPHYKTIYETVPLAGSVYQINKPMSGLMKNILTEYSNVFHFIQFLESKIKIPKPSEVEEDVDPGLARVSANIKKILYNLEVITALASGKPVYVFFVPNHFYFKKKENKFFAHMKNELRARNIKVIALEESLAAANVNELFFKCDVHWNEKGNVVIGKALAESFVKTR